VRWALAGSVLVHGVLAWLVFSKEALKPAPLSQAVEIAFAVSTTALPTPATASSSSEIPSRAETPPPLSPTSQAKSAVVHGGPTKATTETVEGPLPKDDGAIQAAGTPSASQANPLMTFQPAHPNLNGPMKFPASEANARDPLAPPAIRYKTSPGELPKVLQGGAGVTAIVAEDGSIHFNDPKAIVVDHSPFQAVGSGVGVGVSGHFDLTDRVMKLAGQDPYASVKRKMADETREERVCMARRHQGERQKQELFALSAKVRRIATRADLSPPQRRELVFDIWDECTEESPDSTTDYGAMARATILSIVREAFPAGSDVAYQSAQLLALNQRRSSRQPFAPYDSNLIRRAHRPDAGAPTECP
jgi:hypothetical protein